MEPDAQPVKAKRRLVPIPVTSSDPDKTTPGFGASNTHSFRIFSSKSGPFSDIDLEVADISNKKRTRTSNDLYVLYSHFISYSTTLEILITPCSMKYANRNSQKGSRLRRTTRIQSIRFGALLLPHLDISSLLGLRI
jgi:hypothetical protein